MTPSHGVRHRHDREKGSGRLGYLPLASTIRVKQRELSLKRLGSCWDAPRSQRTLPACDDDSQSSRRRCPFRGSGVPHQWCRGLFHWHSMLPTAGVQLQFWNAVVVVPEGVWTSLVDARYEPRPTWHPRLWIGRGHLSSSANELGGCVLSIPQCSKEDARWLPLGQFLHFFVG